MSHRSLETPVVNGAAEDWYRVEVTPRSLSKREGVVLALALITAEHHRVSDLGDVERRLNEIYGIADIGDFEYIAAEDRTRLSPPILRMFGLPSDSVGKSHEFFSSVHPDDQ